MPDDITHPLEEYRFPNLKSLSIAEVDSFPWIRRLQAPNLTVFRFYTEGDGNLDNDCTEFLRSCKLLATVEVKVGQNCIPLLAQVVPNILHLTLRVKESHLLSITHWEEGGHSVTLPFPALRTLTLCYEDLDSGMINWQYFDELVEKRCLPRSNVASKLDSSLSPLQILAISDFQPTSINSVHYHTATVRIIRESLGIFSAILSWTLDRDQALAQDPELIGYIFEYQLYEIASPRSKPLPMIT
ncbi:hypothetical protein M408DRAFT_25996 [Serendipita vermifera MAFF 305830]|uniref:F-box domain-containing protein n=1 Tax=Serendipita vermifera MAFF 305830 TaxID=933852 RepID=A0A0C3B2E1_SERVB|nr:hypothetical protein M408DRAFT_25996 [Serendipita vermifera MAFF 305830]